MTFWCHPLKIFQVLCESHVIACPNSSAERRFEYYLQKIVYRCVLFSSHSILFKMNWVVNIYLSEVFTYENQTSRWFEKLKYLAALNHLSARMQVAGAEYRYVPPPHTTPRVESGSPIPLFGLTGHIISIPRLWVLIILTKHNHPAFKIYKVPPAPLFVLISPFQTSSTEYRHSGSWGQNVYNFQTHCFFW